MSESSSSARACARPNPSRCSIAAAAGRIVKHVSSSVSSPRWTPSSVAASVRGGSPRAGGGAAARVLGSASETICRVADGESVPSRKQVAAQPPAAADAAAADDEWWAPWWEDL